MIAIVYGSSTETTKDIAQQIAARLQKQISIPIEVIDVAGIKEDLSSLQSYDILLLGCPTWNIGELQDDWYDAFPLLDGLDLSGKTVALFGCGDSQGYPDNYQDALGILGRKARERGAQIVGRWPIDGYDFFESQGVEDDLFFGLALDEMNEPELTPARLEGWIKQLVGELAAAGASANAAPA